MDINLWVANVRTQRDPDWGVRNVYISVYWRGKWRSRLFMTRPSGIEAIFLKERDDFKKAKKHLLPDVICVREDVVKDFRRNAVREMSDRMYGSSSAVPGSWDSEVA